LGLLEDHAPAIDERCFVGDALACSIFGFAHVAHDGRQRQLRSQRLQFHLIAIDKRWPFQKVQRQITAEAQLGKDRQSRAAPAGVLGQTQDFRGIPRKITNRGIELREGYLHSGPLEYRTRRSLCNPCAGPFSYTIRAAGMELKSMARNSFLVALISLSL